MNTKRDTLIFQLVKYLIDNDKQGNHTHAVTNQEDPSWSQDTNAVMPQYDIQEQLQSLNNTVAELKVAVQRIQPNGHTESKPKELNGHATSENGIYHSIVNDLLESAEYKLQNMLTGSFLANTAHKNFYLWSGTIQQSPCFVLFHCESPDISSAVLSMIASNLINESQLNVQQPSDMMRLINRKMQDVFQKYPEIPKNIKVGIGLINKKQAKVVFSGSGLDLYQVNDEQVETFEGTQPYIGMAENQYQDQEISIRRGQALYIASKSLMQAGIDTIWKTTLDDNLQDKKNKTTEWLAQKNSTEVILGLTF